MHEAKHRNTGIPPSSYSWDVSGQISELFPHATRSSVQDVISARVRGVAQRHDKQLVDRVTARSTEQFKRSIFGMVQCYNALLQSIIDETCISSFQKRLQLGVMKRVRVGHLDNWQGIFKAGQRYSSLLCFQAFFV